MVLSVKGVKDLVKSRFTEGQTIILVISEDTRKEITKIKVKIKKFYTNFVLVERKGYYEGYTYWDILIMARQCKPKEIVIPNNFKRKRIV